MSATQKIYIFLYCLTFELIYIKYMDVSDKVLKKSISNCSRPWTSLLIGKKLHFPTTPKGRKYEGGGGPGISLFDCSEKFQGILE